MSLDRSREEQLIDLTLCEVCNRAPSITKARLPGDDHRTYICGDCLSDLRGDGGPLHTPDRDR